MMLEDLRDYIETLGLATHVYMGKMPDKQEKAIGVYNSKHSHSYRTAIGGADMLSHGVKYVTFLVHWNKSPRQTEEAAVGLFNALQKTREANIKESKIKMIQLLTNEPVPVDTDEAGIYEMVIEAAVIYAKKGAKE